MNELAPRAFWFTFGSLLIYMCIDQAWGPDGWILAEFFFFFFFFFAFSWTVTSQSSEKRKKRNDANIQLSWPNEQYEFDIIRIKMTCLFWETGKKSKGRERFLFVLPRAWDREKILSPHEESNLRDSDTALRCSNHWATENPRWARGLLRSSYDTRPTYC